jgi:hypothetical protein
MDNKEKKIDLISKINKQNEMINNLSKEFNDLYNKYEILKKKYNDNSAYFNIIDNTNKFKDNYNENYDNDFLGGGNQIKDNQKNSKFDQNVNNFFEYSKQNSSDSFHYSNIRLSKICYNYDYEFIKGINEIVLNKSYLHAQIYLTIKIHPKTPIFPDDTILVCLNPSNIYFKDISYKNAISTIHNSQRIDEFKIFIKFKNLDEVNSGKYELKAKLYSKSEGLLGDQESIINVIIKDN